MLNSLFLWLILLALFYFAYALGARSAAARMRVAMPAGPPEVPPERLAELETRLSPMLVITGRKVLGGIIQFEGHLRGRADEMFAQIREAFAGEAVTPLLLEGEVSEVRLMVLPEKTAVAATRPNWALHWILFAATFVTTTWAGAAQAGVNLIEQPSQFSVGLPYSIGLLLVLGAHELGHYFTARVHGVSVTPPYFIPVPFALGTFGAFIKIKSLSPDRRALFDVAVAGPLAGLVFAVPALLLGLHFSKIVPVDQAAGQRAGVAVNSSILLAWLAKWSVGASVAGGDRILLHPLAFAGWLGLIVTALNLLPIGQLDGGHISHAMFGQHKARILSMIALAALFGLALFVWPG
ncbi:MAG TPA: site-2 protease family protein, partial [Verrucomicrobiae bacterium]|nr:site-2 protease family protein [Verrucomicrobiae bacterium]